MEGRAMRYRLTLILIVGWFVGFGQSVPNTSTFTIGQVMLVVYGDSTAGRNTATLFPDSNAAFFDPAYGSKIMSPQTINGYRNYGYMSGVSSSISSDFTGSGSSSVVMDFGGNGSYSMSYSFSPAINTSNFSSEILIYDNTSTLIATEALNITSLTSTQVNAQGTLTATLAVDYSVVFHLIETVCTRPTGLTDVAFYYSINGTTVTTGNICAAWSTTQIEWLLYGAEMGLTEGSDVYDGYTGTSCDKLADGYYLLGGHEGEIWTWYPVYVSGGKWYYQPC